MTSATVLTRSSFDLWFLGGEQPGWRTLLDDCDVDTLGVSFWGLSRRLPKRKPLSVLDWGWDRVYLDSGGFSANKATMTVGEAEEYAKTYRSFVEANLDQLEIVSEFDFQALGPAWIENNRKIFWNHIDPDQFLPMWHPEQGLEALERLADAYPRVGVSQKALDDGRLNITPRLNALARRGTLLHGVAMTKPDVLSQVHFTSAGSTSWLSPMQYGDTIIWAGNRLHRYPKKMKDQARARHRNDIIDAGFDVELIEADNSSEVARLSVWSWLQFRDSLRSRRGNPQGVDADPAESGTAEVEVATSRGETRNAVPTIERETITLPVLQMTAGPSTMNEAGELETRTIPRFRSGSSRVCNTCYIRDACPAFAPDNACKFDIPIQVRTKEQRKALMDGLIELQAQRVAFAAFVEQQRGGYPDANMSQEYDRLLKAYQVQADLEDNRDFLRINVEARGQTGGVLSSLFGKAPERELHSPLSPAGTDQVLGRVLEGKTVTSRR